MPGKILYAVAATIAPAAANRMPATARAFTTRGARSGAPGDTFMIRTMRDHPGLPDDIERERQPRGPLEEVEP